MRERDAGEHGTRPYAWPEAITADAEQNHWRVRLHNHGPGRANRSLGDPDATRGARVGVLSRAARAIRTGSLGLAMLRAAVLGAALAFSVGVYEAYIVSSFPPCTRAPRRPARGWPSRSSGSPLGGVGHGASAGSGPALVRGSRVARRCGRSAQHPRLRRSIHEPLRQKWTAALGRRQQTSIDRDRDAVDVVRRRAGQV